VAVTTTKPRLRVESMHVLVVGVVIVALGGGTLRSLAARPCPAASAGQCQLHADSSVMALPERRR
jgi:hypothetical protein